MVENTVEKYIDEMIKTKGNLSDKKIYLIIYCLKFSPTKCSKQKLSELIVKLTNAIKEISSHSDQLEFFLDLINNIHLHDNYTSKYDMTNMFKLVKNGYSFAKVMCGIYHNNSSWNLVDRVSAYDYFIDAANDNNYWAQDILVGAYKDGVYAYTKSPYCCKDNYSKNKQYIILEDKKKAYMLIKYMEKTHGSLASLLSDHSRLKLEYENKEIIMYAENVNLADFENKIFNYNFHIDTIKSKDDNDSEEITANIRIAKLE